MSEVITIRGARLHNLKNISLAIPKNQLVVLTGVSGSGKSTLGFDILFKEGQRQYLEAAGWLPLGMSRPPVESISGLSPTISIDQHLFHHSPRSTLGTVTDVYTYLRLLYARLGQRSCPACGHDIPPVGSTSPAGLEEDSPAGDDKDADATFPCPHCSTPVVELRMAHFSFNKPAGACPTCTGLGSVQQVNFPLLVDEEKTILTGAIRGWNEAYAHYQTGILAAAASHYGLTFDPVLPLKDYTPQQRDLLYYGVQSPLFQHHFPHISPPTTARQGRFEGLAGGVLRRYAERITDIDYRAKMEALLITSPCPDCHGARLRPESRAVTVNGQGITAIASLSLLELEAWLGSLPATLTPDEQKLAAPILEALHALIHRLVEVGVGYLSSERPSSSLSTGEAQRLRLASLLGSSLSGVLYIFDEPTIGLHQRDTHRLIQFLRRLRDAGNTVLVIEHDLEVISAADTVIDFGPGAGRHGGQVVACGSPAEVATEPASITAGYISGRVRIPVPPQRRAPGKQVLILRGARHHNLQNIDVHLPLGLLLAVTGVSGSGKSSLILDTLDRALRRELRQAVEGQPGVYDTLEGWQNLNQVVTIDQQHIGRMPRSNAATYSEVFEPIRKVFAATEEAHQAGFSAGQFSFNVPGGRCERCQGSGTLAVKMHFMPDVEVTCPLCHGRRFTPQTLAIHYRGQNIARVLEMTIEEALELFKEVPAARTRLQVLADVGLGYLQLGQSASTLSGGEAQRVKLARELGRRAEKHTLYILDEPTTGLHLADTARLLALLQRLVQRGNSVIVIEHNLELIKTADWVIDLGPEGGAAGGKIITEGTPEQVARVEASFTGQGLRKTLGLD